MTKLALLLALVATPLAVGCLRSTQFHCDDNTDCGTGTCEAVGYCSFADSSCGTGARFGELSGPYAGLCVGDQPPIDGGPNDGPDAPPDAPVGCPTNYVSLPGITGHKYKLVTQSGGWQNRRDSCSLEGTYMAIPDDATELAALITLSGTAIWVGISDTATENTFVTVLNQPQTFLPWAAGQPDDKSPGEDCVLASTANMFSDERCQNVARTVCECEPPM
ncbi:MAG TPA: lectin-like protein [Kofleriaceae bacterium]|nr:lectin-like protein [Kofleriaceae bacterium]